MIDQHGSLAEKFLKKGFWLYLFSFIIAPIGYVVKIIVSQELTVSEVGVLYGVLSFYVLLSSFNDLGMTESLNYFIPKYSSKKAYNKIKSILFYAFLTQLFTGILIALFLFYGADFLANNYFKTEKAKEVLQIFSIFFLGMNLFRVIATFFIAIQNTFYNKLTEFIKIGFTLISILIIFFLDIGTLTNYTISWVIGLYFGVIFALYFFYKKYYKVYFKKEKIIFNKKLFTKVFSYAIVVFVGAQASTILSQVDMQMVIYMLGTEDAGYYTNYLSIISIPFMVLGPIMFLLFPIFSELHGKKDYKQIKLIKQIFQKNFIIIVLAFNVLFFVFAQLIGYILFGEKFIQSGNILQYSVLFLFFNFLLQINFHIFAGIGKVKERVKIILTAIIFNIILNIILIKLIGVYGAALATACGWMLIWIMSEIKLEKKYKSNFDYSFLAKNILLIISLGIFSHYFILEKIENISRIQGLIFMILFSLIYFGVIGFLNKKDFKNLFLEIKKVRKKA